MPHVGEISHHPGHFAKPGLIVFQNGGDPIVGVTHLRLDIAGMQDFAGMRSSMAAMQRIYTAWHASRQAAEAGLICTSVPNDPRQQ